MQHIKCSKIACRVKLAAQLSGSLIDYIIIVDFIIVDSTVDFITVLYNSMGTRWIPLWAGSCIAMHWATTLLLFSIGTGPCRGGSQADITAVSIIAIINKFSLEKGAFIRLLSVTDK